MKIYENLWKSITIYEHIMKSMKIQGYMCSEKRKWVIFYILNISTPHISVLQREINSLNREDANHGFRENMDFDMQNAYQSHELYEIMK